MIVSPSLAAAPRRPRPDGWLLADLVLTVALVALLVLAATHTGWQRFHGKAMPGRAVLYPLLLAVLPAAWWLLRTRRPGLRYPGAASFLMTAPFVIDMAGNALDLFDRVTWFDDACHFANWALLCTSIGLLLRTGRLPAWAAAALCAGFGAVTAIAWETLEYVTFVPGGPEAAGAYRDTIGDLTLGLAGSLLAGAAICAGNLLRPSPPGPPETLGLR